MPRYIISTLVLVALAALGLAGGVALSASQQATATCVRTSKTLTIPGSAAKVQTYADGLTTRVPSTPQRTVAVPYDECTTTVTSPATTITTTATTTTTEPPVTTTEPPPATEPAAIAGQGYHMAFADEFGTLDRAVWDDHIWYDDPPLASWPGFQTASNGILDLRTSRNFFWNTSTTQCKAAQAAVPPTDLQDTCNWPINTVTTYTSGKSFQYGYFEARMKWTKGSGSWPAFWLISTAWAKDQSKPSGEIDVFEGQGSEPDVFYGTVHSDSAHSSDQQNGNNYQPLGIDLSAGYHTYGALWTATEVRWYVDNQFVMSAPTYANDNQPMFLLLQMWVGGWTQDTGPSTPTNLDTQVDWVHVWQK